METIEVGYWISATLKKDTAPLRCFVGQVRAVDQRGISVTLRNIADETMNYGLFYQFNVFIPWSNLESALIATPHDYLGTFSLAASKWQDAMVKGLKYDELQE
jgi:hypothetical protein